MANFYEKKSLIYLPRRKKIVEGSPEPQPPEVIVPCYVVHTARHSGLPSGRNDYRFQPSMLQHLL